ncbi:MAG: 3-hydroxyacyl-CoA dehydrogenase NAD-binding domain-containing protein [Bacteroidales bacterium]
MKKIGVLGSGAMGAGIAQVAATMGHEVVLYDNAPSSLQRAEQQLTTLFQKLVEKGKFTPDTAQNILARIKFSPNMSDFADTDLVIEAIIEDLGIKQQVFQQVESVVSEDCILASNTSSLSIASIAAACKLPHRFLGIHFFNPVPLMELVEIIPAVQTNADVVTEAKTLIDSWKKRTVMTKDTPGFIVNRVARPYYGEALRMLEEGIADCATIDWAMTTLGGFRMGPFTLMDFIGMDVNYRVTESVFQAFFYDPKYKPSFTQKRLFEAGFYGKKSGRGFYDYAATASKPLPNEDTVLGKQILDRMLIMLINEAADAVFWNVASAEDVDTAMTKGVNYPKGLLQWAKEIGYTECVNQMDTLYNMYREDRYRCSPILRKWANAE